MSNSRVCRRNSVIEGLFSVNHWRESRLLFYAPSQSSACLIAGCLDIRLLYEDKDGIGNVSWKDGLIEDEEGEL